MKTGSQPAEDLIVQRLNAVSDSHPELRAAARLYEAILPIIRDADIHVALLHVNTATVYACLERGIPVLSTIDLEVEFQELEELMMRLIRAVESMAASETKPQRWRIWQHAPQIDASAEPSVFFPLRAAAAQIRMASENGCLEMGEILGCAASGNYAELAEKAACLQLDSDLLSALAQNALKSALHSCRREIMPLAAGMPWDRGYCLICGATATLGELQDNDQVKHLRCGQCGADWHFNRLQCLNCGNLDHTTQQTLSADGCNSQRIEACDMCGGYLKVIASFAATPPELLIVEDLATLHLDFIAQQKGYAKDPGTRESHQSGVLPFTPLKQRSMMTS